MNLKEYIEHLQSLAAANPSLLKVDVLERYTEGDCEGRVSAVNPPEVGNADYRDGSPYRYVSNRGNPDWREVIFIN